MGARTGILKAARRERLRDSLLLLAATTWLLASPARVPADAGCELDDAVYATGAVFHSEADPAD